MTGSADDKKPERPSKPKTESQESPEGESSPRVLHGLPTHGLPLREQLRNLWPLSDWEIRG
jgi:hypothetical protein